MGEYIEAWIIIVLTLIIIKGIQLIAKAIYLDYCKWFAPERAINYYIKQYGDVATLHNLRYISTVNMTKNEAIKQLEQRI